jgi:hypothetical protein
LRLSVREAQRYERQSAHPRLGSRYAGEFGAGEFGFSPAARARVAAGVHAQPAGKFDGLLA